MTKLRNGVIAAIVTAVISLVASTPAYAYTTSQYASNLRVAVGSGVASPLGTHQGGNAYLTWAGVGNVRLQTVQGSAAVSTSIGGSGVLVVMYHAQAYTNSKEVCTYINGQAGTTGALKCSRYIA